VPLSGVVFQIHALQKADRMAFVFNQPHYAVTSKQAQFERELIRATDRTKLLAHSEMASVRQMTYNFEPMAMELDHTTYEQAFLFPILLYIYLSKC